MNTNILLCNLFLTNNKNIYLFSNTNYIWKILCIKDYNKQYCGHFGYNNRDNFADKYKNCKGLTLIMSATSTTSLFLYPKLEKISIIRFESSKFFNLPSEISLLTSLIEIILSCQPLEFLPNSFGNLINLNVLTLSYNNLICLPKSFKNLINLQYLNLRYNNLTIIPKSICKLTNLIDLNLDGNILTKIPKEFNKLINLKQLYLSNNKFKSTFSKILNSMPKLILVEMKRNPIISNYTKYVFK
jgi:Leucine-rich repeat (LRR) protein